MRGGPREAGEPKGQAEARRVMGAVAVAAAVGDKGHESKRCLEKALLRLDPRCTLGTAAWKTKSARS